MFDYIGKNLKKTVSKKKAGRIFFLLLLFLLMAASLTACDMFNRFTGRYNAEIIITGVRIPEHYSAFTVVNDYNEEIIDWQEEGAVEEERLSGTFTDLRGEVEIQLRIDNQEISLDYSAESSSQFVNSNNNQAEFELEVVSDSILLKTLIEIDHKFPASRVDNFYSLGNQKSTSFTSVERSGAAAEFNQEAEEIIVGVSSQVDIEETVNYLKKQSYEVIDTNEILNAVLVKAPESGTLSSEVKKLSELAEVRYAEPNSRYHLLNLKHPNDRFYSFQWNFPQIRLPQAWEVTTGSDAVSIAILDTGINTGHEDIGDLIDEAAGYNFANNNYDFTDNHGHGTHVAGTIAANTNNNSGVAGVLWKGRIIPVKVLNDYGFGTPWRIANGILYAAGLKGVNEDPPLSDPADIINLSLGSLDVNNLLKEAVKKTVEENILIIAAAGNDGDEKLVTPASFPEIISVGAVDFNYPGEPELAPYSNFSAELDILAPGGNLDANSDYSSYSDGVMSTGVRDGRFTYILMHGTSMAAAHVSGVAGLMLARGISPGDIRETLKNTAMKLSSYEYDAGLVNAYWAVNQVENIQLNLYRKENMELIEVESKEIPVDKRETEFVVSRNGNYLVEAVVDVRGTGEIDPGDYMGSASLEEAVKITENVKEATVILEEEY